MKQNQKNMIALIIAVVIVICWIFMKSMGRTEMLEGTSVEELENYVTVTKNLNENPFYLSAKLSGQISAEDEQLLIELSAENKKDLVMKFLKSM